MRILVIEDEFRLQNQIRRQLEAAGYMVDTSSSGDEGLFLATEYRPDAAIIDIGLPGKSGLEIIKALRERGSLLPILILTARSSWQDKVQGLEMGADDYLTKPFQMEELQARVRALLRRAVGIPQTLLKCGPIAVDVTAQSVSVDGANIELTSFEYRLLEELVCHRGEILSKESLADALYPHNEDRDSNVLEVMIGRLRRKLDPEGTLKPIETMRGRGYRFTLECNSKSP
ncbi:MULTISPECIES: response regulator transcription factor [Nitrosomonas]|uniref:Possible phoP Response regulators consisting of a CheY-like receiver domain and a HTH DNA-binding domain n=1 Tax=Nitrosomonas europaea (strain ATCC 19718 / CIP 103999 / KCTC 2705 / NBRC 14298) TaxID=228410 RepID=Q820L7_NITEU|nr:MULTISPECIES: response regulator transcription factor [Nitrosomonas]KXK36123.1 MAG: response regulator PhoP [Nitrosomonas europaea]MBV6388652.1 Transcriptional regulatory protein PhoP [Nitrosomonas europaea]MEB2331658.1 response regulator transcription factor [Nitrosomonas sp.]QOJ08592.1 MAG: response regulator transcription factor [Nitrosomonas sp. H1_AOB3]CAD85320.1 possible phoP; Response regulators consisting of a CheY-like receiver domain and a HTH DNA-binding domain [Nitrosomonas euro